MFQEVYLHKAARAAEWMIRTILARAIMVLREGGRLDAVPAAVASVARGEPIALGDYLELDDGVLWGAMHTWEGGKRPAAGRPRAAASARARCSRRSSSSATRRASRGASARWRSRATWRARAGFDPDVYVGLDVATDEPLGASGAPLMVVYAKGPARPLHEVSFLLGRLAGSGALARAARPRPRAARSGHACARPLTAPSGRVGGSPASARLVCCAWAVDARAEGAVEPSYGRVEGDVTLVAGAGGAVASGGPRAEGELRARYLETAGVFGTYEDGPIVGLDAGPRRVVAAGLELRPLFLYRWLQGHETHRARLDLAIDSLGLELGLAWQQPQGRPFASSPGFEVGLGLEVPLLLDATGLWLAFHGGVRWSDESLASGLVETADEREAYVSITLAWHQVVAAHVVDVGDRTRRPLNSARSSRFSARRRSERW